MKLNGTHQLLAYADDVNLLGDILDWIGLVQDRNMWIALVKLVLNFWVP
jgi:hypothetical protein